MRFRLPCGHDLEHIWLPGSDAWCEECQDFIYIPLKPKEK